MSISRSPLLVLPTVDSGVDLFRLSQLCHPSVLSSTLSTLLSVSRSADYALIVIPPTQLRYSFHRLCFVIRSADYVVLLVVPPTQLYYNEEEKRTGPGQGDPRPESTGSTRFDRVRPGLTQNSGLAVYYTGVYGLGYMISCNDMYGMRVLHQIAGDSALASKSFHENSSSCLLWWLLVRTSKRKGVVAVRALEGKRGGSGMARSKKPVTREEIEEKDESQEQEANGEDEGDEGENEDQEEVDEEGEDQAEEGEQEVSEEVEVRSHEKSRRSSRKVVQEAEYDLSRPCLGGPSDQTILSSFNNHVK
ncbi:hypothetical protein Sjap_010113 [Stephania japonica]|uniref:Uncharacterized protein n=1 Tax=Stephania japonica TaxID=461633 RepID=A0AAP0P6U3_9MAGN